MAPKSVAILDPGPKKSPGVFAGVIPKSAPKSVAIFGLRGEKSPGVLQGHPKKFPGDFRKEATPLPAASSRTMGGWVK